MSQAGGAARLLSLGDVQLVFLPHSEIAGPAREPKRILINFRVDDAQAHADRLERLGATWVRQVEPEAFGLLGNVADPDGNFVQVTQVASRSTSSEEEASRESPDASR
jgi:hypothetical protein